MSDRQEGEKLWVEPRPHLVIHGANINTPARFAYGEKRHDKCVPYLPASRVTELERALEIAREALGKITSSEHLRDARHHEETAREALKAMGEGKK